MPIAMCFILVVSQQINPMVGILAPMFYVAAWIHTNAILTAKQHVAREQYLKKEAKPET